MLEFTMLGEGFGRLAAEAVIRKASTESELERLVAAFQIFLETTVALKRREEGEEAAWAFHHAARAALNERIARYAQHAEQGRPEEESTSRCGEVPAH